MRFVKAYNDAGRTAPPARRAFDGTPSASIFVALHNAIVNNNANTMRAARGKCDRQGSKYLESLRKKHRTGRYCNAKITMRRAKITMRKQSSNNTEQYARELFARASAFPSVAAQQGDNLLLLADRC